MQTHRCRVSDSAALWQSLSRRDFWFFRLLLQLTQSQQMSFALERNLRTQQEIAEKVKKLNIPADALLLMEEVRIPGLCRAEPCADLRCSHTRAGSDLIFSWRTAVSLHCVPLGCPSHPSGPLSSFPCCVSLFLFLPAFISVNEDCSLVSQPPRPK